MTTSESAPRDAEVDDPQIAKLRLEVEVLRNQNEKLSFEVKDMRNEGAMAKQIKRVLPITTGLIAVIGFWFGIFQYMHAESLAREQRTKADDERAIQQKAADEIFRRELKRETAKPLWEKQLSIYLEVVEKTGLIANTEDEAERKAAETRFWTLYWGPMAAVEDVGLTKQQRASVERAMVDFGRHLEKGERDRNETRALSLAIARAIRDSIAPAFELQATDSENLRSKR